PDYYDVLGVPRGAPKEHIRKRFRELARQLHPDVSADPTSHERFIRLSEAYHVLGDDGRRAAHDLVLRDRDRLRQAATPRPPPARHDQGPQAGSSVGRAAGRPTAQASRPSATPERVRLEQLLREAEAAYRL